MRSTPGPLALMLAGGVIVLCGVGAAVLAPDRPLGRTWPGLTGREEAGASAPGAENAVAAGTADGAGPGSESAPLQRIIRATQQVVEQASPIVRGDGVLIESLGIESPPGTFLPLLQAGQRVPVWKPLRFRAEGGAPADLVLHLLRGLSTRVAEDHSLGWYRVGDLQPVRPGQPRAIVIFRIAGGAILLAAIDPGNGRGLPVTPAAPPVAAAAAAPEAGGR